MFRLCEAAENFYSLLYLGVTGRVTYPEMRIFFTEYVSRNNEHVVGNGLLYEFASRSAGRFDECVKRSARLDKLELVLQPIIEKVPFPSVCIN